MSIPHDPCRKYSAVSIHLNCLHRWALKAPSVDWERGCQVSCTLSPQFTNKQLKMECIANHNLCSTFTATLCSNLYPPLLHLRPSRPSHEQAGGTPPYVSAFFSGELDQSYARAASTSHVQLLTHSKTFEAWPLQHNQVQIGKELLVVPSSFKRICLGLQTFWHLETPIDSPSDGLKAVLQDVTLVSAPVEGKQFDM